MKLRSQWEFGEASECRRGLLCGMGISPEEQARPLIGVVNSWNEYNPGHVHLRGLAERVKQGIRLPAHSVRSSQKLSSLFHKSFGSVFQVYLRHSTFVPPPFSGN